MIKNLPCSIFRIQLIYGWLSPTGNILRITLSVFLQEDGHDNVSTTLSQISELYFSLIHSHTSIYLTLASKDSKTSSDSASTSSDAAITTLDATKTPQISCLYFVLQFLSIFLSINIFSVLRVIPRVREYFFPTVTSLQNLAVSSGILRGTGIYRPLDMYCSIQF